MIDEVLREIKAAEERAAAECADAQRESKEIVLAAEAEAESLVKAALAECKADYKAKVRAAEDKAALRRAAILGKGEEAAAALADEKHSAVQDAADDVLEALLSRYSL